MVQQFNPKRVLRQISNSFIKEFFEKQKTPLDVDWYSITNTQVEGIFDAWQRLADGPRKVAEIVFQDVHEMANENGVRVIIEDARFHGEDLGPLLEKMDSRYDKAIWTAMNRPGIWEAAVRFAKADSLSSGRSWVKRGNLPITEPQENGNGIEELKKAMSAFFRDRQGRGHHCKVEHFPRADELEYYFVYLSDYADTYINFDDAGEFQRTPERRAFEVVFAHNRASGTLDVFARGGKQIIEPLQQVYSKVIIGQNLEKEEPGDHPYHLDGLMEQSFAFPTDPEDGIEKVSLRSLRLSILGQPRKYITLEPDPEKGPGHIYEMLEQDLNSKRLHKSILRVTKATLNFKLNDKGPGRSLTFSVSYPNSCNLKSKREDQRLLGEKYLQRWKIDVT